MYGWQLDPLLADVRELMENTHKTSSVVENLNSRLRCYFFLRRQIGKGYLDLLRFFLHHRRFPRNAEPGRVGKSPAELLPGEPHPHWLEMLGYPRFSRTWIVAPHTSPCGIVNMTIGRSLSLLP